MSGRSVGSTRSISYKKALFSVSNKLSNSDVANLKFLCGDLLPRRVVEEVTSGLELFSALEEINQLSHDNLEFLQIILDSIGKGHLVEEIRRAASSEKNDNDFESLSSDPPSLGPTHPLSIKFKTFLVSLGSELPARDLKYVAYFFRGLKVTGLSVQEVQRLREPAQLFDILKRENVISPTKVGRLKEVMEAIGRIDLKEKVVEYMESVEQVTGGGGGGGGSLHGGVRAMVLDSNSDSTSDSMSSDFSFDREVSRAPPRGPPWQPTTMSQEQPQQPKTGFRDNPHPQSEQDRLRPDESHIMVAGYAHHRRLGQAVEESQGPGVQQAAEYVTQPVGGENAAKMVGVSSGRSINLTSSVGSKLPRERERTRTQLVQLERNEALERVKVLENQLAHERVHVAEQRHRDKAELEEALCRKNAEINQLLQTVAVFDSQLQTGDEGELYPMNSDPPHGVAIVIVNDTFDPHPHDPELQFQPRRGADRDQQLFLETFKFLKYEVEYYRNLTSEEMYQVISTAARRDHGAYDSFVCCVSTHGSEELIYGSDSVGVKRSEMIQIIKRSKALCGKPKMFFLQACRNRPDGVEEVLQKKTRTVYQPNALSQDADVFVANATTNNTPSYRDPATGSWFVTTLHKVFTRSGYHLTLTALLQEVNREVCVTQGTTVNSAGQQVAPAQQCAEVTSSFRYGLRFKFAS